MQGKHTYANGDVYKGGYYSEQAMSMADSSQFLTPSAARAFKGERQGLVPNT